MDARDRRTRFVRASSFRPQHLILLTLSPSLLGDVFASIRSIKLFAWEAAITARLAAVRSEELHELRRRGFLIALAVRSIASFARTLTILIVTLQQGFSSLAPFLVAFASLASFAAFSGRTLTADIAFPAIALFAMLVCITWR